MEIMPADEAVSQLIGQDAQPEEILAAARRRGMRSLWESGLDRLWHGQTTLEELVRVLGEREVHAAAMERASAAAAPVRPSQVPTAVEAAVVAAQPANGTPRVLMADDDPQMRRLVRTVLEREGIQVSEANDGLDALDLVGQQHFDLLILDLSMPRLDGLGVLEELGAQVCTAQLPVIVLTASGEEGEAKALDLGAQDYLTKPVRPTALTARVRAVLRRVRA
jgi:CheY-like chemotaxis protein